MRIFWRISESPGLTPSQAATDPRDPSSVLRLSVAPGTGGVALLRFTAMAGKTYTVSWKESLSSGTWQSLTTVPSTGTTRVVELSDSIPPTAGQRYYCVELAP